MLVGGVVDDEVENDANVACFFPSCSMRSKSSIVPYIGIDVLVVRNVVAEVDLRRRESTALIQIASTPSHVQVIHLRRRFR